MNYADLKLGTWYPMGGMYKIIDAFVKIGRELGVQFHTNEEVISIHYNGNKATGVETRSGTHQCDAIIAAADYHHVDRHLLPDHLSNYSDKYWNSRVLAPSSLLFYLGIDFKVPGIKHHNLF